MQMADCQETCIVTAKYNDLNKETYWGILKKKKNIVQVLTHERRHHEVLEYIQGPPKKCIHTLTKENFTLYNRLF